MVEGVVWEGIADFSRARQSVLVECLCEDAHHAIEVVGVGVLMGTVATVRPEVHVIARDDARGVVVPETDGFRSTVAEPVAAIATRTHVGVPPHAMSADTNAMECLVHDGAWLLIRRAGTDAHPTTIATVGSRRSRTVGDADAKAVDAGEVVPVVVHGGVDGIVDAVVGLLVATVVVPMADDTLWHGDKLDDIAIAHGIVLRDGVGTHVVNGSWPEVAQPVNLTSLIEIFGGAVVGHLRIGLRAPAESLLDDVLATDRAASECPGTAADEAWVCLDDRCLARAFSVQDAEGEGGGVQGFDGGFHPCIRHLGSVVDVACGLDGILVVLLIGCR